MPTLPLFPLGTVLLPGGRLPLQVFEPRYLALVATLLEQPPQRREFGVVAIRRGHEVGVGGARTLHVTGTVARLDAVVPMAAVGLPQLHLLTTGIRRFRLEGLDPDAGTPYLTARVSGFDESEPGEPERELAAVLRSEHAEYLQALGLAAVTLPEDPAELPYRAVDTAILGIPDRQRVLDTPDLPDRLALVARLLRRERAIVERFGALPVPVHPGAAGLN